MDVCDYCCGWARDHREAMPAEVERDYPAMMVYVLGAEFGVPEEAAEAFVDDACDGNWERLHITQAEKHIDAASWAEMLLDEVFYFSDRWSWDRALRVQWLYRRLVWQLNYRPVLDGEGACDE